MRRIHLLIGLVLGCFFGAAWAAYPEAPGFTHTGMTHDLRLTELSGLAPSRRHPGIYWGHNDSGNAAELFALRDTGEIVAQVKVRGALNLDWEDIASYVEDGKYFLAIGDIGDNLAIRSQVEIYIVPEPELDATEVTPVREYDFSYPDGPHDAESLAVDYPQRRFLIMDKDRMPPVLHELPMMKRQRFAQPLSEVPGTFPDAPAAPANNKRWRASPTAMDLTADGLQLVVLTYRHLLIYQRSENEDWNTALQRAPQSARLPKLGGLEAACWDADGKSILISGEGQWAHYYRFNPAFNRAEPKHDDH